jgi:hypothetical protein
MIRFTKTQTRDNPMVPFYESSDDAVKAYFYNKFIKPLKFLADVKQLSDDKLTLVSISDWASVEDYLDLLTDEYCYVNIVIPSKEHNKKNNIILTVIAEEI